MDDHHRHYGFRLPYQMEHEDRQTIVAIVCAAVAGAFLIVVVDIVFFGGAW